MTRLSGIRPNPSQTVDTHLKLFPHRGYAVILCGRVCRPNRGICGGDLGRVYALPLDGQETYDLGPDFPADETIEELAELAATLRDKEPPALFRNPENLDDPTNYALTTVGKPDTPTLSGLLRLGLSGVTADDVVDLEGGTIGLWVAFHERGYTRLANGDYAVVTNPERVGQSWRVGREGRVQGRDDIPTPMLRDVDQFELADATGHSSRSGGWVTHEGAPPRRGVIGARPVLSAVIVCPKAGCSTRNAVRRLNTGELPDVARQSFAAEHKRRVYSAFERAHPVEAGGDDVAQLPRLERERRLRQQLRARKAAYQRWLRDDKHQ